MTQPMKEAIQKAIEGGYPKSGSVTGNYLDTSYPTILLQPKFWQALGKTMGWGIRCPMRQDKEYLPCTSYNGVCWQCRWHTFIDHIAEGKDVNSFFKELLANQPHQ